MGTKVGTTEIHDSGSWSVRVDTTLDYGCFLMSEFEGNTAFRIGFNATDSNAYLLVGDTSFTAMGLVALLERIDGNFGSPADLFFVEK